METSTPLPTQPVSSQKSLLENLASLSFQVRLNTFLEYAGAALGIIGWLGVRQVGSPGAQQIGFLLWVTGGLTLVAWGYHTRARGIMAINTVNTVMAASALAATL